MGRREQVSEVKKYPGVEVRGKNIRIKFVWPKGSGKQQRITLKGMDVNDKNLKYALNKVQTIKREIDFGVFEWSTHFPDHPLARTELKASAGYTVANLLDEYLAEYAQSRREGITLDNYTYRTEQHLKPYIGDIPVNDFKTAHAIKWATQLGDKNVSRVTLKSYIAPLRAAFKWARQNGRTGNNPFVDFEWPEETRAVKRKQSEKRRQKRLDVFNEQEINTLVNRCNRPQEANIFQFGFWTGLRPEELFALHWDDVDLVNNTVLVNKAKVYRRGFKSINYEVEEREELKGVKTGELGEREVLLLPAALKAIQAQKQWTATMRKYVFHNPYWNKPWTSTNQFANRFKECCMLAGVRYRRPYMMRHTYASMMLKHGEDEGWVARQMGHVDTTMIRKVYREFIPDADHAGGYRLKNDWSISGTDNQLI